ncbi:30S ribosomal protein S2 [bacterium]|nr:30S ribosomal protein S2 [bacterium]
MAQVDFTIRELMEAGVHFGHKTKRWNPKMAPFLFGIRHDIHIIDLQQTYPMLKRALKAVNDVVSRNGRVLFVGTKRQAQTIVAEHARRSGQYYVNHRWLGGMLTNWKTISHSIKRLREIETIMTQEQTGFTKKEMLQLERERESLDKTLGGIRDMGGLPDIIFVIDTNKESIALKEAARLGIPVIAILDSNSDPDGVTYPVPGNDDSARAIETYCRLVADSALAGIEAGMIRSGVDIGEAENLPEGFGAEGEGKKGAAKPAARKRAPAKPKAAANETVAEDEKKAASA